MSFRRIVIFAALIAALMTLLYVAGIGLWVATPRAGSAEARAVADVRRFGTASWIPVEPQYALRAAGVN